MESNDIQEKMAIQENFEVAKWDTKVAIKADKRHGQAFNPSLPSNYVTAVVLSFFGLNS